MQLYQFLNADSTAVLQTETRRCIYLEQPPTIHTEAYIKWRDGWTEIVPATHVVTTPYSSTVKPAWIEKVGDEYVEHPEETIVVEEIAVDTPETTIEHPAHTTGPYVAPAPLPPPPPPTVVSMRQARLALNAAGLLGQVEAAVASSTEDVRIDWQYSSEIRRDWPTLVLLAGALGLTEAQLDNLFIQASQL